MKTPIEKAAEAIGKELPIDDIDDDDIAILENIIRRVLSREVPKRDESVEAAQHGAAPSGHNECRRILGLEE